MESSIEFRNLTCLDHAYVNRKGMIVGGSYHVSVTVTGQISEDEHVVLDFSAGKKQIKEVIDDSNIGYDHKLIIFPDSDVKTNNIIDGKIILESPYFTAEVPWDSIQFSISRSLVSTLEELLKYKFPNLSFKISLSSLGFTRSDAYFNYVHGLKNSSSFGCQNIHHGHTSFVEVIGANNIRDKEAEFKVANLFDKQILLFRENIVDIKEDEISIVVDTNLRGTMKATYKNSHNWIIMDTETTIEFMVEYAAKTLYNDLRGKKLFISEGLQKGAVLYVN